MTLDLKKKTKKNANTTTSSTTAPTAIAWKFFNDSSLSDNDKSTFSSSLLFASHKLADSYFDKYKNLVALPELLSPLLDIIRLIRPQGNILTLKKLSKNILILLYYSSSSR